METLFAIAIGVAAGTVAGVLGVGGGVLFVPALALLLGLSQLHAEATSLLAIIPVALLGTWRQHHYGNIRLREGVTVGVLSVGGVTLGTVVANAASQQALRIAFAGLLVLVAVRLARHSYKSSPRRERNVV